MSLLTASRSTRTSESGEFVAKVDGLCCRARKKEKSAAVAASKKAQDTARKWDDKRQALGRESTDLVCPVPSPSVFALGSILDYVVGSALVMTMLSGSALVLGHLCRLTNHSWPW